MSLIEDNASIAKDQEKVRIYGYCSLDETTILKFAEQRNYSRLTELKGEYTLVIQDSKEIVIITSKIGALHYFYYYDGVRFAHGDQLIPIVMKLNLSWIWDYDALGDLCSQENLTDNQTLHKHIKRIPPGSILRFDGSFSLYTDNFLDSLSISDSNATEAVEILNSETLRWITSDTHLSLSGGFDSRVILSSMLKHQVYPTLVTVGNNESSDVMVSKQIARTFGLKHKVVTLVMDEIFDYGENIAQITNGTKPACHWHTYLYPKKAEVPNDQAFYVGTLGEFARSYYFDKGLLGMLADINTKVLQERYWEAKLLRHSPFHEREFDFINSKLVEKINITGQKIRALRNTRLARGDFLSGGTRFYLEQRVPNFYANGIRMYNDTSLWRSPFHNLEWLRIIWNLCDNWKLGSNWHRLAIRRNFPALLDFPEEKGFRTSKMLERAPLLYWTPMVQRVKYSSYDMSSEWYSSNTLQSFMIDNSEFISEFIDKKLLVSILHEHKKSKSRTKTISFMLTLMYFKIALTRFN